MLQLFKFKDSLSLRGNVKGHYGGLFLHPNCFLHAIGCFSWGIDLAMHVLGEFARGLVVSVAAAYIRLL